MPLVRALTFLLCAAPLTQLPAVLKLDDALQMGRSQHPLLAVSQSAAAAAGARVHERRAAWLPALVGVAAYQRTTANFVLRPGSLPTSATSSLTSNELKASGNSYNYFNLALQANQLVWDFYQTLGQWRAAEESALALDQNTHVASFTVDYNIRNAYFQAYAAKALVQVGQETLANQQKHLDQIVGYIAVGQRAEIDLAQAKNDVATAKVQLITAENNYRTAKAVLNQAMGVEAKLDYDVASDSMAPIDHEDTQDETLVEEALSNRPELAAARANVRSGEENVAALKGQYWPALNVSASITDQGIALNGLTWNWAVGAAISWPFLVGGLNQAQIEEGEANLHGVQASAELARQQVRLDVEQARLAVRAGKETLEAAGEALFNARERLKYAEGRYETGAGSIIELGDAQVAVTTAAAQVVQAQYQLDAARAALLKALGRGV